ncbi:MAG TPA: hypothetical protein VM620_13545 [Hyphomicrobium sp.]|nr:hypothetical protein [Hyphomicrobium sp.]
MTSITGESPSAIKQEIINCDVGIAITQGMRIPVRQNGPSLARVLIFVQLDNASMADLIELLSWRAGADEDENFVIIIKVD